MGTTTRRFRYDWYGALAGVGLPLLGTVIEALRTQGGLSPASLLAAHAGQPLLWIMDTTPFVLGGLGRIIVRQHEAIVEASEAIVRMEQARREGFEMTATQVFHAAQGLLGNVGEFTTITTRTAAIVRETTGTMHQLSQTAASAALTAETVIGLAQRSERATTQGLAHAEASAAGLLGLAEEVRGLSGRIEGLSLHMQDLLAVAGVVADVSERAGRAAEGVERAASAGGDAAPELQKAATLVRGHAEESQRAAGQVRQILGDVQRAVLEALRAAEAGGQRAREGARVAAQSGEVVKELSTALRESARAAREIARVAQQQESGIEQVLKAMNSIALSTEDTVAATRHVEGEARALNGLADHLRTSVKAPRGA